MVASLDWTCEKCCCDHADGDELRSSCSCLHCRARQYSISRRIRQGQAPAGWLRLPLVLNLGAASGCFPATIMPEASIFKDEKITAMFCTSTLVEGVNLPADNLFITSYYSGRVQMTDVDFRNLIGRVGRIQYNTTCLAMYSWSAMKREITSRMYILIS